MNTLKLYVSGLTLLLLMMMMACNSPDAPDCLKSAGEPGIESRKLGGTVEKIELNDLIDLVLTSRGEDTITLSGPSNLLNDVTTSFESGKLSIQNHNTCNWVRRLDHRVVVTVSSNHLKEIDYWGQGDILGLDTIRGSNFLLESHHGSGNIELTYQVDTLKVAIQTGVAALDLSGKAKWFEAFHQGYAKFNASRLESDLILANSNSINDMHLHVNDYLFAYIQSKGNIYYTGNPDQIDLEQVGSGQLINE